MKSIDPDDFKVTGKTDLSLISHQLVYAASDDKEKLDKVRKRRRIAG
jgi:hypothetical protein